MCELSKKKKRFEVIESNTYVHEGMAFNVHGKKGSELSPLCVEILRKSVNEILAMRQCYSRVCAIRFDLRVPEGMPVVESNALISTLFAKLKDKFKAKKWDNQPIKQFVYGWVWEIEEAKQAHYHLWIALPGNQVNRAGYCDYGIFGLIKNLWFELTNEVGLAHLPENPDYMINRHDDAELREFVYRVSYLAKERGKYSLGTNTKCYDGSRLHGAMMRSATLKLAA